MFVFHMNLSFYSFSLLPRWCFIVRICSFVSPCDPPPLKARAAAMRGELGPGGLLLGLTLVLLCPACGASSLGLAVHVVPLDADGGNTVLSAFLSFNELCLRWRWTPRTGEKKSSYSMKHELFSWSPPSLNILEALFHFSSLVFIGLYFPSAMERTLCVLHP